MPGREGYTAHFQQYMQGELEGLSSSPAVVDKLLFVPDEHQTIAVRFISVLVKAFYREKHCQSNFSETVVDCLID